MKKGMTASSQKETKCIFRIEEDLLKSYKSICEKNGYDMSKRLRLFVKDEIENKKNNFFIFEKHDNRYKYLLHDKSGVIFFCRTFEDKLLSLPEYESIIDKLDKLCNILDEYKIYNFRFIEELL